MKKNKKFYLWGILIVSFFMCFSTYVFAEDEDTHKVSLNSDNTNPQINDSFTVLTNLETTSDKESCTINISYDTTKLSLESVTGVNNYNRNPLSLTVKTQNLKANSQIKFKAIAGGQAKIKVDSVGNCGNTTELGSIDINVKDVELSTLKLTNGELSPAFNPNTVNYTAVINADKTQISATADNGIKIAGVGEQTINAGESKDVKITVTSSNGSKKVYTIKLTRPEEKSENHYLKNITFNNEIIEIENEKTTYNLVVKNNVETADLKYELEDEKSKATVKGPDKLDIGINTFVITVTAEDGSTKEYKLLVTRQDVKNIIDNDVETILEEIENGTENSLYVSINQDEDDKVIDKSIIKALKKYGKTITYEVTNEDGDILYSISLRGKDVKKDTLDLNYGLNFKSNNKIKIQELIKDSRIIYLKFNSTKELPGKVTSTIFVGDKFKNNDTLYLYYYNEKENKLEKVQKKLTVKGEYVEFELEKFGEYILSKTDIDASENTEDNNNMLMYIIIAGGIIVIIIVVVTIIMVKNKKKKNGENPKPKKEKKKKEKKQKNKEEKTENQNENQNKELEKTIIVDGSQINPSVIANTPSNTISKENEKNISNNASPNSIQEQTGNSNTKTTSKPQDKIEEKQGENTSKKEEKNETKEETKQVEVAINNDDIEIIDDLEG